MATPGPPRRGAAAAPGSTGASRARAARREPGRGPGDEDEVDVAEQPSRRRAARPRRAQPHLAPVLPHGGAGPPDVLARLGVERHEVGPPSAKAATSRSVGFTSRWTSSGARVTRFSAPADERATVRRRRRAPSRPRGRGPRRSERDRDLVPRQARSAAGCSPLSAPPAARRRHRSSGPRGLRLRRPGIGMAAHGP